MKNIILQRTVAVQCWNVVGTIAKASERLELMPVLLRVRECDQTDAEDVAEHLYFESRSRRVVARRQLHIAATLRLLQETGGKYSLTDDGIAALDTEQIFVPERDCWTIWASDDPMFDHPILRVERWREPTATSELTGKGKKDEARRWRNVPRLLRESLGQVATPPSGGDGALRVDELDETCESVDSGAEIRLVWNVTDGRMRLDGSIRAASLDSALDAPALRPSTVWQQLLTSAGLWSDWDERQQALLVRFEATTDRERESVARELAIDCPTLTDLGQFDAVTVPNVPLQAGTDGDAQQWAEWRLRSRLRDYATEERFDRWCEEATAPLNAFPISLGVRADLANDAWNARGDRPSAGTWHVVAAEDWSL